MFSIEITRNKIIAQASGVIVCHFGFSFKDSILIIVIEFEQLQRRCFSAAAEPLKQSVLRIFGKEQITS